LIGVVVAGVELAAVPALSDVDGAVYAGEAALAGLFAFLPGVTTNINRLVSVCAGVVCALRLSWQIIKKNKMNVVFIVKMLFI